jgi:hypothetical protein
MQTGVLPADAIKASRGKSLHKQAAYKTATPLKLHALKACFLGDVHIRPSLRVFMLVLGSI